MVTRGTRGALTLASIMPRDASLSWTAYANFSSQVDEHFVRRKKKELRSAYSRFYHRKMTHSCAGF